MNSFKYIYGLVIALATIVSLNGNLIAGGPGQQAIEQAAENDQFSFVLFYRTNDPATQQMNDVLHSSLSSREDSAIVHVQVNNGADQDLIKRFDATRMPMPAVAVIAPNGAVCGVYPHRVNQQQLEASIVSPGQAACLKGLQENKIVLLCAQPTAESQVPSGVQQFQADKTFANRTTVISVLASDKREAGFLKQLQVPTNNESSVVAFMAPPGVMVGVFNADISHTTLAAKLAEAGRCCDDPNCNHHHHR